MQCVRAMCPRALCHYSHSLSHATRARHDKCTGRHCVLCGVDYTVITGAIAVANLASDLAGARESEA